MEPQKVQLDRTEEGNQTANLIAFTLIFFGILLCITLIGLPLGIPMILFGWYIMRNVKKRRGY